MRIRIYNAINRDGYVLDQKGEHFLYFTADKKEFAKFFRSADCLVLNHANYEYLTRVGLLPAENKFIVVVTEEKIKSGDGNVWFTDLDPKQIKREIKIQGYNDVLCLVDNDLANKILAQKIATEVHVVIYHAIQGGGVEKVEIVETMGKKIEPKRTQGADFERLNYVLKK